MKYLFLLFLSVNVCCNNQENLSDNVDTAGHNTPVLSTNTEIQKNEDVCWSGHLNGKIPILVHYQKSGNLIAGQIIYLHTKDQQPITLIGTVEEENNYYRLLEFEKSGNISGVITGLPTGKAFTGTWTSPKTKKEFLMNLTRKDTIIHYNSLTPELENVYGHYHYQYSESGYQGDFDLTKLSGNKVLFGITSVTSEPARNVAHIDTDTITLTESKFIYSIPGVNDCEFEIKLFKGFAIITYTKGYCESQFGNNATVDGIYLKAEPSN